MTMTGANILSKQLFFSKMYKQSQLAYYVADDALACAMTIDDTYVGSAGYGFFPGATSVPPLEYMDDILDEVNTERIAESKSVITLNDIKCAQVAIFSTEATGFQVAQEPYIYEGTNGQEIGNTSTFTMKINIGGDTTRCAKVTVNKTQTFRQIISQGYASCGSSNESIERAVINTTVVE
jgi:hypothetical protein